MNRLTIISFIGFCCILNIAEGGERRIVNGRRSPEGEWPYITYLEIRTDQGSVYGCAGSLIAPDYILTAGHCLHFEGEVVTAATARYNFTSVSEGDGIVRQMTKYWVHPQYDDFNLRNDVSIIELEPADPALHVSFARLAVLPSAVINRPPATIAGWGSTSFESGTGSNDLLQANVTLVDEKTCVDFWKSPATWGNFYAIDYTRQVCASTDPSDACQGDSGGPLLLTGTSVPLQVGIVSFGLGCGPQLPRAYAVYTRVGPFLDFVCLHTDRLKNSPNTDLCIIDPRSGRPAPTASPSLPLRSSLDYPETSGANDSVAVNMTANSTGGVNTTGATPTLSGDSSAATVKQTAVAPLQTPCTTDSQRLEYPQAASTMVVRLPASRLPTVAPSPTGTPTASPSPATPTATSMRSRTRTASPTASPTRSPTASPTLSPTASPTTRPTASPTASPTSTRTTSPTRTPTRTASRSPTRTQTRPATSMRQPTATSSAVRRVRAERVQAAAGSSDVLD